MSSMELTGLCRDHSFESAIALCRRCGLEFCHSCVVYPFGEKKPLCKGCAMMIAGIKNTAPRPEMTARLVRKRAKLFEKNLHGAAAAMPQPVVPAIVDPTAAEQDAPDLFAMVPDGGFAAEPPEALQLAHDATEEAPAPQDPGHGVAPAVDWSNPFG